MADVIAQAQARVTEAAKEALVSVGTASYQALDVIPGETPFAEDALAAAKARVTAAARGEE